MSQIPMIPVLLFHSIDMDTSFEAHSHNITTKIRHTYEVKQDNARLTTML